jgi:hypothetical protein
MHPTQLSWKMHFNSIYILVIKFTNTRSIFSPPKIVQNLSKTMTSTVGQVYKLLWQLL